jgi:ABC-type Na+ transport system ATPase subunit NatA
VPVSDRPSRLQLAAADFASAVVLWPLWVRLGWHDILYRYRRSLLGPFWLTANTAVTVVALGVVYAQILKAPVGELMPYVCISLLVWNFISAILHGAGEVFSGAESYIKQVRLPYLLYVFRFVWSRFIIFVHDFPIFVVLMIYFGISPGAVTLAAIPAFVLLLANGALVSASLGLASARFRDIDPELNGYDNIRPRGLLLGLAPRTIERHLPEIAEFTELGDYLDMPVRTYSAGMMLRLGFAVATCFEPEILLMDEWILAGDAQFIAKAERRIQGFVERASVLVLSSHNLDLCTRWCNMALWLDQGRVKGFGPANEVIADYQRLSPLR